MLFVNSFGCCSLLLSVGGCVIQCKSRSNALRSCALVSGVWCALRLCQGKTEAWLRRQQTNGIIPDQWKRGWHRETRERGGMKTLWRSFVVIWLERLWWENEKCLSSNVCCIITLTRIMLYHMHAGNINIHNCSIFSNPWTLYHKFCVHCSIAHMSFNTNWLHCPCHNLKASFSLKGQLFPMRISYTNEWLFWKATANWQKMSFVSVAIYHKHVRP